MGSDMSAPSRMVTPEEKRRLDEAAGLFVASLEQHLRASYPTQDGTPAFDEWHVYSRMGAVISLAVQSLLVPEPYGVQRVALDPMVKAIGIAIGMQSANATPEEFERLMELFGEGVGIGRAETHGIAINMPTAGRA